MKEVSLPMPEDGVRLSDAELRRRRARSIAIAVVLGALVALFYALTIVKLGPNAITKPM